MGFPQGVLELVWLYNTEGPAVDLPGERGKGFGQGQSGVVLRVFFGSVGGGEVEEELENSGSGHNTLEISLLAVIKYKPSSSSGYLTIIIIENNF